MKLEYEKDHACNATFDTIFNSRLRLKKFMHLHFETRKHGCIFIIVVKNGILLSFQVKLNYEFWMIVIKESNGIQHFLLTILIFSEEACEFFVAKLAIWLCKTSPAWLNGMNRPTPFLNRYPEARTGQTRFLSN